MTASTPISHYVSTSQPTGLNLGDEWYNPTTNILYKNLLVNGTSTLVNQIPSPAQGSAITMPTGTGTAAVQGLSTNIVSGNLVASTSGTSIDYLNIPSWVRRITVMFNGTSFNSTGNLLVQIGTTSTPTTTGYNSVSSFATTATSSTGGITSSAGFCMYVGTASYVFSGHMVLTNLSGGIWVASGIISNSTTTAYTGQMAGQVALSGTLSMVRITSTSGTDTFDAGIVNIFYE
jgi:hypothetical protein